MPPEPLIVVIPQYDAQKTALTPALSPGERGNRFARPDSIADFSRPHRAGIIRPHDHAPTRCARTPVHVAEDSPSPERERVGVRASVPPTPNLKPA